MHSALLGTRDAVMGKHSLCLQTSQSDGGTSYIHQPQMHPQGANTGCHGALWKGSAKLAGSLGGDCSRLMPMGLRGREIEWEEK